MNVRTPSLRGLALAITFVAFACSSSTTSTKGSIKPKPKPKPAGSGQAGFVNGVQRGLATWYGEAQMTASGERFNKNALTAAHLKLKLGTWVRVTNTKNGRSVKVRINDRGPYGNAKRIIDVSEAAARVLDMIDAGVVPVTVEVVQ